MITLRSRSWNTSAYGSSARSRSLRIEPRNLYFHTLREPEAIETDEIIRPVRIVEMCQPIRECESLKWSPNGLDQIGAGFHHNRKIGCAGDVESKLIVTDTKVRAAGLDQRVPQHGWNAGIRGEGTPASGACQIIDCCDLWRDSLAVTFSLEREHSRISTGSFAHEINSGQAGAIVKRIVLDAADIASNSHIG